MSKLQGGIQNQHGVTLLETLFSVSITLVMATSFYQLLSSFSQNYEIQEAIAETQQQGRVASDLFFQEVRNTGLDPKGSLFNSGKVTRLRRTRNGNTCNSATNPAERILEASPTSFHFLADLNGNGEVNGNEGPDPEEHIRYEWVGSTGNSGCKQGARPNTLYRDSGGGRSGAMYEVATNIIMFNLSYFDEDGNQLPSIELDPGQRESIRRVVLDLTIEIPNISTKAPITRTLSTDIWLRNM